MERSSLNIVGRIHMCIEVKDNESGKKNELLRGSQRVSFSDGSR